MKVHFEKLNGHWVAQCYRNGVCVSWQRVGTKRNVNRIIKKQLTPKSIPFTLEQQQ